MVMVRVIMDSLEAMVTVLVQVEETDIINYVALMVAMVVGVVGLVD